MLFLSSSVFFSAALQYNDPDPYIWMPLYLYGAFLSYQALKKKYHPVLYVTGLTGYASYAVYLFFNGEGVVSWMREHGAENIAQSMKATKPWIDKTREFGGLVILIAVLICNMVWLRKVERFKRLSV